MIELHSEKYPGVNQELFLIRILDHGNKIETAINLLISENGEVREINITRFEDQNGARLEALIEKAKNTVNLITILRRL